MAKRVLILGSTGSIGEQALDVIAQTPALAVAGLSAASNVDRLVAQARESGAGAVALSDPAAAAVAESELDGVRVLAGDQGVRDLIGATAPDLVLNAIVGIAGLGPTIATLTAGVDLALANKESLVVGGDLVTTLAEATEARILPVDSEHSALAQLVEGHPPGVVERLVLTASGGPFRGRDDLASVTVEEALAHPTWSMGGRITIDSATLMNKGLEVIEAHHLFGFAYPLIDVVVHPQSIIHAFVQLSDGAHLAHLGVPDMRMPISYALNGPDRPPVSVPVRLAELGALTFEAPDDETFPCLRLAREAGSAGGNAPCALNAADEVAVAAFLDGRIPFTAIPDVISGVLEATDVRPFGHFEELFACDADARRTAERLVAAAASAPL
jgi:1-deoxy-D-xylulose-5-phosphate reductoisomerase